MRELFLQGYDWKIIFIFSAWALGSNPSIYNGSQ